MTLLRMTLLSPSGARSRLLALAAAAALLVAAPAPFARADEPSPEGASLGSTISERSRSAPLFSRLVSVELQGAIDGPLGVFGGTLVISPLQNLSLEVGGGVSRDGGRFAGGVRLMLPQDHFALQLRLGIAAGPLTWDASAETNGAAPYHVRRRWDFQAGLYSDIGFQYRFDFGLYLGLNLGVEGSFSSAADQCTVLDEAPGLPRTCAKDGFRPIRVYAGLQVGYAFDIVL